MDPIISIKVSGGPAAERRVRFLNEHIHDATSEMLGIFSFTIPKRSKDYVRENRNKKLLKKETGS